MDDLLSLHSDVNDESWHEMSASQLISKTGSYTVNLSAERWFLSEGYMAIHEIDEPYQSTEEFLHTIHPDDRNQNAKRIAELLESFKTDHSLPELDVHYRIIGRKSGKVKMIRDIMKPRYDDGKLVGTRGVIQDVSEEFNRQEKLKQVTAELKLANEVLEESQLLAGLGNWEFDLATGELVGSKGFSRIYEFEDSYPVNISEFLASVHPDDRSVLTGWLDKLNNSLVKEIPDLTFRIIGKKSKRLKYIKSKIKLLFGKGRVEKVIGINQDVTETVLRQQDIEKTNRILSESQVIAKLGGWELDLVRKGIDWYEGELEHYEIDTPPQSFEEYLQYVHPDDRQLIIDATSFDAATGEVDNKTLRFRIITPSGKIKTMASTVVPVFKNNKLVKLRGVTQDITEVAEAEAEILAANQSLNESQRLARMGSWDDDIVNGRLSFSKSLLERYESGPDTSPITTFAEFLEFVHPDDREMVSVQRNRLIEGGNPKLDYNMRIIGARTKKIKVMRTILKPIWAHGKLISIRGSQIDISGSVELIEQLQEVTRDLKNRNELVLATQDDLKETQHIAGVGTWSFDLSTEALRWSEELSNMLELSGDDEQSAEIYTNCIYVDDRENAIKEFQGLEQYFRNNPAGLYSSGVRMVAQKSGELKHFSATTKAIWQGDRLVGYKGVMKDITVEVKNRAKIETLYYGLIESQKTSRSGSYSVLWTTGNVELSKGMQELLDVNDDCLKVEELTAKIHPDDRRIAAENFKYFTNGGTGTKETNYRIITKSGEVKYLNATTKAWLDGDKVIGGRGAVTDVTRFVEYEKKLEKSQLQLKLLFTTMTQGVVYRDATGKITEANPAAERILGPRNAQGNFDYSLFDSMGKMAACHPFEAVLATGKPSLGHSFKLVNNVSHQERWVRFDSFPVSHVKDQVFCIFEDITESHNAFNLLKQSENRFANVFNYSGVGMAIISVDGQFENVNSNMIAITGYSPHEIYTMTMGDITIEEDFKREAKHSKKVLEKVLASFTHEKRIITKSGDIRWVSQTTSCVHDYAGKPLYFLVQLADITEKLLAEKKVFDYQQKFMIAFHRSSVGMSISLDGGRLVEVNDALCNFIGYNKDELMLMKLQDLSPQDDLHNEQPYLEEIELGQRNGYTIEKRFIRRSGEVAFGLVTVNRLIEPENDTVSFITQIQDVTAAVISRKAVENAKEKFEHLFKYAGVGMGIANGKGVIIDANDALCRITGYTREELISTKFSRLTHPDDVSETLRLFEELTSGERDQFTIEKKYIHKSGKILNVIATSRKISSDKLGENLILGQVHDITELRQKELDSKQNELKFQVLVENSFMGVGITEGETIVYANPTLVKMFGYKKLDEFVGLRLVDHSTPETARVLSERLQRISQGKKVPEIFRGQFYSKQGKLITVEWQVRSIELNNKPYRMAVVSDVTQKVSYEKSLEETNTVMQLAQSFANLGSWRWTIDSGELYWSDSIYKIFGYRKHKIDVTYENFLNAIHPDDREKVTKAIQVCLDKHTPYEIEHRILLKNGTVRWVIEKGNVIRNNDGNAIEMYGIVREITESKQRDEELQKSKEKYQLLAESGEELICLHALDGSFLYASPSLKSLLGYNPSSVSKLLKSVDLAHPDDQARYREVIDKVGKEKSEATIDQIRFRHKKGHYVWCELSIKAVVEDDGRVKSLRSLMRDIGARILYRQELENSNSQLEAALASLKEASDAKENFMSVMSHEIRTPLNSVIGLSNLLLNRNPREDQVEIVQTLKGSADNLMNLINDILDYNKIRAGGLQVETRPFDFYDFLKQQNNAFKISAQDKGLEFSINADSRIPKVMEGDVTRLNQIISNLLSNAIKFTHKGFVKLSVDCTNLTDFSCQLCFRVEDSGVGIATNKLQVIFQPFHQSESYISREYGGTGLGLSIVKSLVELMGGTVSLRSRVGLGTTFEVNLPLSLPKPSTVVLEATGRRSKSEENYGTLTNLEVLYVEDVQSNRFLVKVLLSDHNITCTTANTGRSALRLTAKKKYDVILMDIQMPGMDGYQATEKIRNQRSGKNKRTPIIAFTAEPFSSELQKKSIDHDIQFLITKPFDSEKLIEKLRWLADASNLRRPGLFSYSFYDNLFGADQKQLKKITRAVINDLSGFITKSTQRAIKSDLAGIRREAHRIRPILKNLHAFQAIEKLDAFKEHDEYGPEVKKILHQAHAVIKRIIGSLETKRTNK